MWKSRAKKLKVAFRWSRVHRAIENMHQPNIGHRPTASTAAATSTIAHGPATGHAHAHGQRRTAVAAVAWYLRDGGLVASFRTQTGATFRMTACSGQTTSSRPSCPSQVPSQQAYAHASSHHHRRQRRRRGQTALHNHLECKAPQEAAIGQKRAESHVDADQSEVGFADATTRTTRTMTTSRRDQRRKWAKTETTIPC